MAFQECVAEEADIKDMYIYIYICIHITHVCIYIYVNMYREREIHTCMCIYIYIYIYDRYTHSDTHICITLLKVGYRNAHNDTRHRHASLYGLRGAAGG